MNYNLYKIVLKYILVIISTLTACILFPNCSDREPDYSANQETLFQLLSPEISGIHFANMLHETDSFNAIFYEYYYNGAGVAVGDVNNDGLSDIFFGGNMEKSRLYLNKGNLKFEDVTDQSGINTEGRWVTGVSMVDVNQDGWLDIYICVGGNIADDYHNLCFINVGNQTLSFTEQAKTIGLDDDGYSTQAAFFDYDRDGDLDMYLVTSSMNVPNKNSVRDRTNDGTMIHADRLYRNDGFQVGSKLPKFSNVSQEAGIVWDGFGLGICISDINCDGWPDVYIANDYISDDLLYVNQQNGTFADKAKIYFKHTSYSAMGADMADINNDGLVDLFTVDMLPEDYFRKRIMAGNMRSYERYKAEQDAGYSHQFIRNTLQLNNGQFGNNLSFSEIGQVSGVFETDWSWAPLFADFDNDGQKDLFIGNGIPYDLTNMDVSALWTTTMRKNPTIKFDELRELLFQELQKYGNVKKPNFIYKNTGNLVFKDLSASWGMTQPLYSTGAAFSDLDNDGDLDLVLNNINEKASVYENTLMNQTGSDSSRNYLGINLHGIEPNRDGIGAKINVYLGREKLFYEHFPVRGFQSMVDPKILFGLGEIKSIDSLIIEWPDGKTQTKYNVSTNQYLNLSYNDAALDNKHVRVSMQDEGYFVEVSNKTGIHYKHEEREFLDFNIQPLLPHLYSREGPGIAVGDVNGDGLDDFFIGGSTGSQGVIFIQKKSGVFSSYNLHDNPNYEDMGALFFDADQDGDNDLYVVSGGTGLPPGNPFYSDRLYINNGNGEFHPSKTALPKNGVCGSQVCATDYDKDGDLDLFVCGRVDLENYPIPPRNYLFRNDSKDKDNPRFTDVTSLVNKSLEHVGLLSSALWTDYDNDGWTDLMLAGEWMPITIFKNEKGAFINVTKKSGLADYSGWWNSLAGADFDKDGDIDYVAGNLGLNSRFKATLDEPMQIIAKDFDSDGLVDPVISYYVQGKSYPIYHLSIMTQQMPYLNRRFGRYQDYANATLSDIFTDQQLEGAYKADSRFFSSAYIENLGNGAFEVHALPTEAQFAPVFGMLANDYTEDGNADVLLVGNFYSSDVETGRYDAFIGLLLSGDGMGNFNAVPGRESGFFVDGDAKGMADLSKPDGSSLILAAQNSAEMKVFQTKAKNEKTIKLNKNEEFAEIKYASGKIERREFYHGSGYLSQSSRVCKLTKDVVSVKIINYAGEFRIINLTD